VRHSAIERVNELAERMHDEVAICHRHALIHLKLLRSAPSQRSLARTKGDRSCDRRRQSRKTTLSKELLIFRPPLYSMNPSFRNLFMKKFTRERVVPTISASVS
jgi:hypothetical protein